jgi:hypothetical protein
MKNDTTTTLLNFVLAMLVILGVAFTVWNIFQQRTIRRLQPEVNLRAQMWQVNGQKVQMLVNDVEAFNAKSPTPELTRILQAIKTPAQPAAAK